MKASQLQCHVCHLRKDYFNQEINAFLQDKIDQSEELDTLVYSDYFFRKDTLPQTIPAKFLLRDKSTLFLLICLMSLCPNLCLRNRILICYYIGYSKASTVRTFLCRNSNISKIFTLSINRLSSGRQNQLKHVYYHIKHQINCKNIGNRNLLKQCLIYIDQRLVQCLLLQKCISTVCIFKSNNQSFAVRHHISDM